ncbi:MAG: 1-acyl-sn-glycerol-3-phosphate acyltransferase, partial [Clostridia bacterium]|nr:1-acyl-sn-glycerol-3-phosphate acyltransferase [Clostridia bacterium]
MPREPRLAATWEECGPVLGLIRLAVRGVCHLRLRVEVEGDAHLPAHGPAIITANHPGAFDPPVLGAFLPRPIHFLAKEELFRLPLLGRILPHVGAIPVRGGRGEVAALRAGLA